MKRIIKTFFIILIALTFLLQGQADIMSVSAEPQRPQSMSPQTAMILPAADLHRRPAARCNML